MVNIFEQFIYLLFFLKFNDLYLIIKIVNLLKSIQCKVIHRIFSMCLNVITLKKLKYITFLERYLSFMYISKIVFDFFIGNKLVI